MGNCCVRDKSNNFDLFTNTKEKKGFKSENLKLDNYFNKDNRLDELIKEEGNKNTVKKVEDKKASIQEEEKYVLASGCEPNANLQTDERNNKPENENSEKIEELQKKSKSENTGNIVRFDTHDSNSTDKTNLELRKRASSLKKHKKKQVKETHDIVREKKESGEKKINQYEILHGLGEGSFGKVKLAVKRWGSFEQKYACKVFLKSKLKRKREMKKDKDGKIYYKDALQDVMREIAIMKKLDHPNVIRLHEVLDDDEKDKLYMMLDFAAGGQLIEWDEDESIYYYTNSERNNNLSEDELRPIFRDCIKGLSYLHANGIVHRDIKPQNVLFEKNDESISGAKLADFGQSSIFEGDDKLNTTEGTYYFIAPEACEMEAGYQGFSGKAADIWALGVTFFGFTFKKTPFMGTELPELFENIKTKELEFPSDEREISEPLKRLFNKMMAKDPVKRATIKDLGDDEWLNQNFSTKLAEEIEESQSILVTDADLEECVIPLNRVFFLKAVAKKFKGSVKGVERQISLRDKSDSENKLSIPSMEQSRNLKGINIETELRKSPRSPRSPADPTRSSD